MEKSKYSWIITNDYIGNGEANGTIGPSNGWTREEIDNCPNIEKFKMYDDDDELYYSGIIAYSSPSLMGSELGFAPLDDFGMPNAGCTYIKYWNSKREIWEVL